jgi:hypothetical protein
MKSPILWIALAVAGAGTMAFIQTQAKDQGRDPQATNGAYRDGLYLGKLDAENGNEQHIATGRWPGAEDRGSFSDGYRQAYRQVSAAGTSKAHQQEAALVHP